MSARLAPDLKQHQPVPKNRSQRDAIKRVPDLPTKPVSG